MVAQVNYNKLSSSGSHSFFQQRYHFLDQGSPHRLRAILGHRAAADSNMEVRKTVSLIESILHHM